MAKSIIVHLSGTAEDVPTGVILIHLNEFIELLMHHYNLEVLSINHTFEAQSHELGSVHDYESTAVFLSNGSTVQDIANSLQRVVQGTDFFIQESDISQWQHMLKIFMELQHLH